MLLSGVLKLFKKEIYFEQYLGVPIIILLMITFIIHPSMNRPATSERARQAVLDRIRQEKITAISYVLHGKTDKEYREYVDSLIEMPMADGYKAYYTSESEQQLVCFISEPIIETVDGREQATFSIYFAFEEEDFMQQNKL